VLVVIAKIAGMESTAKTTSTISTAIRIPQERRRHELAMLANKKLLTTVAFCHGQDAPKQAQGGISFGEDFLVAMTSHADACVDQKYPAQINHPIMGFEKLRPDANEESANTKAPTTPQNRTRFWYCMGTAKYVKIRAKTKTLSTDSVFSMM
jgi:hypothetical protein